MNLSALNHSHNHKNKEFVYTYAVDCQSLIHMQTTKKQSLWQYVYDGGIVKTSAGIAFSFNISTDVFSKPVTIVSRGDWLGRPPNIKVENNGAVGYVGLPDGTQSFVFHLQIMTE